MRNKPVEIICQHCKKPAMMHSYRLKNGTGKFCGRACYLAHRWPNSGKCKECGKPSKTRFCKPRCQKDYWNKHGYNVHRHASNWTKKFALIAALGGQCAECGFSDHRALDIDHIDPTKKLRPKDGHYTWGRRFADWKANKENIRLLCANCHRLHTWKSRGFGPRDGLVTE